MRKRVLLACAVGALSVVGFSPQAQATKCTSFTVGDHETRCLEYVLCDVIELVDRSLCPLF